MNSLSPPWFPRWRRSAVLLLFFRVDHNARARVLIMYKSAAGVWRVLRYRLLHAGKSASPSPSAVGPSAPRRRTPHLMNSTPTSRRLCLCLRCGGSRAQPFLVSRRFFFSSLTLFNSRVFRLKRFSKFTTAFMLVLQCCIEFVLFLFKFCFNFKKSTAENP